MTDHDKISEEQQDSFSLIKKNLNKEIVAGIVLILFGILLFFDKVLDVNFGIQGLIAFAFLIAAISSHMSFIKNPEQSSELFGGNVLFLISLLFAEQVVPGHLKNLLLFFSFAFLAAISMYAYTLTKKIKLYLYSSIALFIAIILFILFEVFTLRLRDSVIMLFITGFLIAIFRLTKKKIYIGISIITFIFALQFLYNINEDYTGIMVLWILTAIIFFYYLRRPEKWIFLFIGMILLMASFQVFNDTIIHLMPQNFVASYWTLGLGGSFLLIWAQRKKLKKTEWTLIPAIILIIIGLGLMMFQITSFEGFMAIALVLIGIGLSVRSIKNVGKVKN